ncbi:hypothetical protein Tsubulata_021637 [Turnera subulata]|uniref:Uncharacterized protein n=1 Tax=Turnera subulata TaxID=218843 RepID=A0A9Q0GB51_9ROSI|nr:hypothetical protein Tsubulata_021637 [Turnera subulata]
MMDVALGDDESWWCLCAGAAIEHDAASIRVSARLEVVLSTTYGSSHRRRPSAECGFDRPDTVTKVVFYPSCPRVAFPCKQNIHNYSHLLQQLFPSPLTNSLPLSPMDPMKYHSGAEGCSSSESGWTVYIASPMEEDDEDQGGYDDAYYCDQNATANYGNASNEDSDDSMASDASSGPQHQHQHVKDHESHKSYKHDKRGVFNHHPPVKNASKKDKKSDENTHKKDKRFAAHKKYSK